MGNISSQNGSWEAAHASDMQHYLLVPGKDGSAMKVGEKGLIREWDVANPPPPLRDDATSTAAEKLVELYSKDVYEPPDDVCPICLDSLAQPDPTEPAPAPQDAHLESDQSGVVRLVKCRHCLHRACAVMLAQSKQVVFLACPVCKAVHGVRTGTQPDGVMHVGVVEESLPGFEGINTIIITYWFSGGFQGPEHPNPGHPYKAHFFPRVAFLPDNQKGNLVLRLLEVAWQRRLVFTVGTSLTSGLTNVITWNEIHHKTEWHDRFGHGYPDPDYLDNVLMELSQQGITPQDLHC